MTVIVRAMMRECVWRRLVAKMIQEVVSLGTSVGTVSIALPDVILRGMVADMLVEAEMMVSISHRELHEEDCASA